MACCVLLAAIFALIIAMKAKIFKNDSRAPKPLEWRPQQDENK